MNDHRGGRLKPLTITHSLVIGWELAGHTVSQSLHLVAHASGEVTQRSQVFSSLNLVTTTHCITHVISVPKDRLTLSTSFSSDIEAYLVDLTIQFGLLVGIAYCTQQGNR